MKSVLISIKPEWCELIASGQKTIEVRKTKPNIKTSFKCYIYKTKSKKYWNDFYNGGKVIGEFVCDKIETVVSCSEYYSYGYDIDDDTRDKTCLSQDDLMDYGKGKSLYFWHISNLKIYDKPKELSEFSRECRRGCPFPWVYMPPCDNCDEMEIKHPPQSWCYVEEIEE